MLKEETIKITFQVIIIFIFVGVFFFTYAAHIEKNIVQKQVNDIVVDLLGSAQTLWPTVSPGTNVSDFNASIQASKPKNLAAQDAEVNASNKIILDKAVKSIAIITALGLAVIVAIGFYSKSKGERVDYMAILKNDTIILLFVAMVEFSFLTFFAQNYRTIDSNFVKYKTLNTIAEYH